jgi:hypothetical protein
MAMAASIAMNITIRKPPTTSAMSSTFAGLPDECGAPGRPGPPPWAGMASRRMGKPHCGQTAAPSPTGAPQSGQA